ncbi:hypothetical protein RRF57_013377 [Xylaria bambusicola]|uniref:Uncharacterized protein n=1 Tax=Xylaria bambusicola TaxID=326684 RepID=A0AAN7UWN6_9PEZI
MPPLSKAKTLSQTTVPREEQAVPSTRALAKAPPRPGHSPAQAVEIQGHKVNRFAGKSSKRAGSPSTGGRAKFPRRGVGIVMRDELAEELKEVRSDTNVKIDQLRKGYEEAIQDTKKAMCNLGKDIQQVNTMLMPDYENGWRKSILPAVQSTKDNIQTLEQSVTQLQESQRCIQTQVTELLTHKNDILAAVHRLTTDMKIILDTQKSEIITNLTPPETEPLPGQNGYLAQCIAPYGCVQQTYESILLRAAWLYIHMLGNPDDGVTEDEGALSAVLEAFPQVNEDHVVVALDHVHMQAYGKLFS